MVVRVDHAGSAVGRCYVETLFSSFGFGVHWAVAALLLWCIYPRGIFSSSFVFICLCFSSSSLFSAHLFFICWADAFVNSL